MQYPPELLCMLKYRQWFPTMLQIFEPGVVESWWHYWEREMHAVQTRVAPCADSASENFENVGHL